MRFLLLNQYYPPDVAPTGRYLHDLARNLVQRGHQVKVLCSRRSYDGATSYPAHEIMDGIEVARLRATAFGRRSPVGRMADYASFYGALLAALMTDRKRPDLVLSLTTPPYLGLLGKLAAKRHGCHHAHWIMDLYPDVMFAHGMARRKGLLLQLLTRLTRFQLAGAQRVLALGPEMAKRVLAHVGDGAQKVPVDSVPLWSAPGVTPWPDTESNSLRTERGWSAEEVIFLYSGNLGLGHRFGEFLEAARQLGRSGPRWVFSGGGKRKAEIERAAKAMPEARIEFHDYVADSMLRAHLGAGDVHLASLDSSWQGLMVPSKIQASFAAGRPVLYVGGRECETANWILDSGGGWVVAENDVAGLLQAVAQALDPGERHRRGRAALEFARKNFQMSKNCPRLAELLEQTSSSQDERRPSVSTFLPPKATVELHGSSAVAPNHSESS